MTINFLMVSELSSKIYSKASMLNLYQREGMEDKLIATLQEIKNAAAKAEELLQWRYRA